MIDCTYENDEAIISITDTGIGIQEEKQEIIFSAFSQGDPSTTRIYGGTGLGLTISRKLVEKMGGKINLKSNPGEGSCFTLQIPLPAIDKKTNILNIPGKKANPYEVFNYPDIIDNLVKYHILVAEDTPDNQLLFKELLKRLKVNFEIVPNGKKAMELLKKQHYDLLLLDMQMPVMDGMETISRIRADHDLKDLYVIALTAHSLKGDEEKYKRAGCDDYMSKPININYFYNTIVEALRVKENISLQYQLKQKVKEKPEEYDIRIMNGKRDIFNDLLIQLKGSCDLFNPQVILSISKELETCLEGNDITQIKKLINEAACNYDDDLLLDLIPFLEEL